MFFRSAATFLLFAALVLTQTACALFEPQPAEGYKLSQSVHLNKKQSGMNGELQILQDARLAAKTRKTVWQESAAKTPLRGARLRLVDAKGLVIEEETFEPPRAKIKTVYLYGNSFPTYLVTVDFSCVAGSYCGPNTLLAEVRNGDLVFIPDAQQGEVENHLHLKATIKAAWRIVSVPGSKTKEIESVSCHPNYENTNWDKTGEFVIEYNVYRFDGSQWQRKNRSEIGFWESDQPWPARDKFPE